MACLISHRVGLVLGVGLSGLAARAAAQSDPRAGIFLQHGCNRCHGAWALGIKPRSDVGPDLTFAYVDVTNRYGVTLEAFLTDPSGVMRLMLASHLHLTVADRDSIAHILKGLSEQHQKELKGEVPPMVPPTPGADPHGPPK